jgi:hypothetical protein
LLISQGDKGKKEEEFYQNKILDFIASEAKANLTVTLARGRQARGDTRENNKTRRLQKSLDSKHI